MGLNVSGQRYKYFSITVNWIDKHVIKINIRDIFVISIYFFYFAELNLLLLNKLNNVCI